MTRYRVTIRYPDRTVETRKRNLSWNVAQIFAADIRKEYTYSNGGARCLRVSSHHWILGVNLPGPRAVVNIESEAPRFQVTAVRITDDRFLRRVIFRPYRPGMGPVFVLDMWDTYRRNGMGKSTLGYRLTQTREHGRGSDTIFQSEDFHCSPMHAVDSDATVAALMGFLTLRPGDTDREYFDSYSEAQVTFCESHGEALAVEVIARYGEH